MQVYNRSLLGASIMDNIGHTVMQASRGIISLAKDARGDTPDVYTPAGPSMTSVLVYGGLFAAALYVVVKK